jgi:hypothetical protein
MSPAYLDAVADDLAEALRSFGGGRVSIFSAGTEAHATFSDQLVPCDARLQPLFGGARASLNVRCLRHALQNTKHGALDTGALRRSFSRLLGRQPAAETAARSAMTDDEVRAFIRQALTAEATARPSPLLRRLRDAGRACEQSRFSRLFRLVAEGGRDG